MIARAARDAGLAPLLGTLLSGCSLGPDCADTIVRELDDPVSGLAATLFVRDCGATTAYATHVAIAPRATPLDSATIAFTADDNHGRAKIGSNGALAIGMAWNAPRGLEIIYPRDSRIFRRESGVAGATIVYRTDPAAP